MSFGRNDAKAETPVLWPPHAKSWLIGKDPDAGRDWGQEEKGTLEDEMAGWHHQLDGHEFEWTPEVSDGLGGLACCNSWGRKESDTTERLNWTELRLSRQVGFFRHINMASNIEDTMNGLICFQRYTENIFTTALSTIIFLDNWCAGSTLGCYFLDSR